MWFAFEEKVFLIIFFYRGFSDDPDQCHSVDVRSFNYDARESASREDLVYSFTDYSTTFSRSAAGLHSDLRGADEYEFAHQARTRVPRSRRRVDGVWGRRRALHAVDATLSSLLAE